MMDCSSHKSYIQRKRWKKLDLNIIDKNRQKLAIYDVEQYLWDFYTVRLST